MSLAEKIIRGDIRAAGRLISMIDDCDPTAVRELKALYPATGRAKIIGITGPPGAGKSTLTDQLIQTFRQQGKEIAVIAIDPTSHLSGGAILGDRIRMNRHATDPGVFIRSLGTRGHLGGISRSTNDVINVFDAMGKDIILIETVGVGQDEVEITRTAHTSLVVMVPGLGDEVQAIKAGLLEIADIFVLNKADRPGAEKAIADLQTLVEMNHPEVSEWWPPIVQTVAHRNIGVSDLVDRIDDHLEFLEASGHCRRFEENKGRIQLAVLLQDYFIRQVQEKVCRDQDYEEIVRGIASRRIDPYSALEKILAARGAALGEDLP